MGKVLKWLISVIVISVALNAFFKWIGIDDYVRSMTVSALVVSIMGAYRNKFKNDKV